MIRYLGAALYVAAVIAGALLLLASCGGATLIRLSGIHQASLLIGGGLLVRGGPRSPCAVIPDAADARLLVIGHMLPAPARVNLEPVGAVGLLAPERIRWVVPLVPARLHGLHHALWRQRDALPVSSIGAGSRAADGGGMLNLVGAADNGTREEQSPVFHGWHVTHVPSRPLGELPFTTQEAG